MSVYFIRAGMSGPVKIGIAENVGRRRAELQIGHYETLVLLRTVEGDVYTEQAYHARYGHLHIRGEWFQYADDMLTALPESMEPTEPAKRCAPERPRLGFTAEMVAADKELIDGLRAVMRSYAAIGREMLVNQQVVNNWLNRGIPWSRRHDMQSLAQRQGVAVPSAFRASVLEIQQAA